MDEAPVILRPAEPGDVPAITAIYAEEVLNGLASFEECPPDVAEMTRRYEALRAAGHPYIVATLDGAVAGYAYAGAYRPRPAYRYSVEVSVYLDASYRRRGIGRRLLEAVMAESAAAGKRRAIAIIGDSENRPSIALHEAAGFQRVGTIPSVGFKFGRWVDSVIMHAALGEGDESLPEDL